MKDQVELAGQQLLVREKIIRIVEITSQWSLIEDLIRASLGQRSGVDD